MNYLKIISEISKNNYKFYFNPRIKFFVSYKKSRLIFLKKINILNKYNTNKNYSSTFKKLSNINNSIKKNKDKQIILNLYKKIEIFQKIYASYNKLYLKKKTNREAEIESYILLNKIILELKEINNLKKLNVTLKINDKVLLNFNKIKSQYLLSVLSNNLKKEISLIKGLNV